MVFKFVTTYNLRAFKGGEQPVSHRKLTTHLPLPQALSVLWKPVAFWPVKGFFKVLHVDFMKLCCRCHAALNVFCDLVAILRLRDCDQGVSMSMALSGWS